MVRCTGRKRQLTEACGGHLTKRTTLLAEFDNRFLGELTLKWTMPANGLWRDFLNLAATKTSKPLQPNPRNTLQQGTRGDTSGCPTSSGPGARRLLTAALPSPRNRKNRKQEWEQFSYPLAPFLDPSHPKWWFTRACILNYISIIKNKSII